MSLSNDLIKLVPLNGRTELSFHSTSSSNHLQLGLISSEITLQQELIKNQEARNKVFEATETALKTLSDQNAQLQKSLLAAEQAKKEQALTYEANIKAIQNQNALLQNDNNSLRSRILTLEHNKYLTQQDIDTLKNNMLSLNICSVYCNLNGYIRNLALNTNAR